ncbi:helix-turn-helix domain-containing protein [Haloechinothrix alba]|uniref:helix-turn-helix domain-containing protein n=1 Tax=Haloechinothrix alba TaxID=664784 RepID=UPI003CCB79AB
MSNLWSQTPISIRLDDLDVICSVLECDPADLLIPEPPVAEPARPAADATAEAPTVRPRRGGRGRSVPPV